jgi:transcription factor 1
MRYVETRRWRYLCRAGLTETTADDVLKYVGHTLDKHKGCDILDINPGAGLWSQKLHAHLQPRSHVLLEQRHDKFHDFLDPLLHAPGSKYSLVAKDPTVLDTYRELVAEGAFPHQTPLDAQDPRAQEPNNTLLVTGSLVWDPRLPGMGFDSMAKQLFHHFTTAAWTNDLFHKFGLVRTVLWVQSEDFNSCIAESISTMLKTTRFLEMSHKVDVLVGGVRTPRKLGKGSIGREPQYEIESMVHAMRKGREHGMVLPPHRRDTIHDFAEDVERISNGTGIMSTTAIHKYLYEQQLAGKTTTGLLQESTVAHYESEKAISEQYPDIKHRREADGTIPLKTQLVGHPARAEFTKFFKTASGQIASQKVKVNIESVADTGEQIYNLECKILRMPDGPEKDACMTELAALDASWEKGMANMQSNYWKAPLSEVDDRLAIRSPPYPRIQWDARSFEPLIMRASEVWPSNRLSLISASPLPKPSSTSPDWYEWVQDFVFGLYSQPSDSIDAALDKMQHGLSSIMDECPSLRDVDKGGRLQMRHLRVRMLTVEMIGELVESYRAWPFKAPGSDHNKFFRHKGASTMYGGVWK